MALCRALDAAYSGDHDETLKQLGIADGAVEAALDPGDDVEEAVA